MSSAYKLAGEGDWDGLVSFLEQSKDPLIGPERHSSRLYQEEELVLVPINTKDTLLHIVCYNATVPPRVIEAIIEKDASIVREQNWLKQTALHVACAAGARSCIVRPLVEAQPETTRTMDGEFVKPLDIVCQKLIMKEERQKYSQEEDENVHDLWESCRLLIQGFVHSKPTTRQQQGRERRQQEPMVHLCVKMGSDCPIALWERVLLRYEDDLRTPDEDCGNVPLHIAASIPPPSSSSTSVLLEGEVDHLYDLLKLYPQASRIRNGDSRLPLQVALDSGRGWNTGIFALLSAYPAALESLDLDTRVYPEILAKLTNTQQSQPEQCLSILCGILVAKPDLMSYARNVTFSS